MQGKNLPEASAQARVYLGIDVCKAWLDIYLHPTGQRQRVANHRDGLRRLRGMLAGADVALAVMEATGKYHRLAQRTLHAWGLAVTIVNPLRARLFAQASGIVAKTDPVDARMLALYGACLEPAPTPLTPKLVENLQELVRARHSATVQATALANRLEAAQTAFLKRELKRQVKNAKAHIKRLDDEIQQRIKHDPALKRRYTILASIPGVGPVTAATLVAGLNELGNASNKAITMLAGLAPIACDSGDTSRERHIKGGRAHIRPPLYMAALAAIRTNPHLEAFYKRLRDKGKPPKLAITAVMRKLIVLANSLIKQNRQWQPSPP